MLLNCGVRASGAPGDEGQARLEKPGGVPLPPGHGQGRPKTRPDSPGEPGLQPRDPCLPWPWQGGCGLTSPPGVVHFPTWGSTAEPTPRLGLGFSITLPRPVPPPAPIHVHTGGILAILSPAVSIRSLLPPTLSLPGDWPCLTPRRAQQGQADPQCTQGEGEWVGESKFPERCPQVPGAHTGRAPPPGRVNKDHHLHAHTAPRPATPTCFSQGPVFWPGEFHGQRSLEGCGP